MNAEYQVKEFEHIQANLSECFNQYSSYFENFLAQKENFRDYVAQCRLLTQDEKNQLIAFHNFANSDEIYGERLY